MSRMEKWLVPYMVMSAWLTFVLIAMGLVIRSPHGLIEVKSEVKRTKEIASYVTASIHGLFFLVCAVAKYFKRPVRISIINKAETSIPT